jgi:hypothetical protein
LQYVFASLTQGYELKLGHLVPVVHSCLDADKSFSCFELQSRVSFVEVAILHALDVDDGLFVVVYESESSDGLVTLANYDLRNILLNRNFKKLVEFSCVAILGRAGAIVHFKRNSFQVLVKVVVNLSDP